MRALVTTKSNGPVSIQEVADPVPAANEAIISVRSVSLNRGESRNAMAAAEGQRPGWDSAGVVLQAAADGSGPAVGSRVVGFTLGKAWAEQVAVRTGDLAVIPESVTFAQAATLPVAGLTALRVLRIAGFLPGRRVAITGATGGVGRFAIQLAANAGAEVTAIISRPGREDDLRSLGATDVRTDLNAQYDVILDSVGGSLFAQAFSAIAPGGDIVVFGSSSAEPTTFDLRQFYNKNGARLHAFLVLSEPRELFNRDLSYLASQVAQATLDPQITVEASWQNAAEVMTNLLDRKVTGKAVLHID